MSSQPAPQPRIVFEPFDFSPASGELRRHGRAVRLQGQPIQVLEALLAEPGQLVTRESLQQRIWSGAVSGDFEHGLNAAVNKLRQALGDSAEDPRFVETIAGKGYRFIAATVQLQRPVLEMKAPPPVQAKTAFYRPVWAVALAALVAVGGAGYWIGKRSRAMLEPVQLTQFPITPPPGFLLEGAGNRQGMAVSPNGSKVAFTAMNSTGLFHIFVRALGDLESHEVPESTGAGSLFWLPDESLVYVARGKVRRLAAGAQAAQILSEKVPVSTSGILLPQGRLLMTSRFRSAIIPANGGPVEHLKAGLCWPQLLPDGEHILHAAFDVKAARWSIRTSRFNDPAAPREIVMADSRAIYTESRRSGQGYLMYTRGGALLAQAFDARTLQTAGDARVIVPRVSSFMPVGSAGFSVSSSGELLVYQNVVHRSQMIWVDRGGRRLRAAGPDRISTKDARLSPDGKWFASAVFDVERGVTDIWLTDTATGLSRRQIVSPVLTNSPVWSPDGKRLAFMRTLESTPKLFVRTLEGQEAEQSLAGDGFQVPTDWTSDGRFILYTDSGLPLVENEGQADIWVADLARGGKLSPLVKTQFHEASAVTSPDGRWVAFMSSESGRAEVYLQRLEIADTLRVTGLRHPVSRQGAVCLRWRRDGKELFYLAGDGQVYAVPMGLGAAEPRIGAPQPLFRIEAEAIATTHSLTGFDVAADGNSFVVPSVSSPEASTLVAVQNWEEMLKPTAVPISTSRR